MLKTACDGCGKFLAQAEIHKVRLFKPKRVGVDNPPRFDHESLGRFDLCKKCHFEAKVLVGIAKRVKTITKR